MLLLMLQNESARARAGEAKAAAATKRAAAAEDEARRLREAEREIDGRFHRAELEAMGLKAAQLVSMREISNYGCLGT